MIINKHDKKLEEIKNRGAVMESDYLHIASDIISNVRKNGDKALFEYTKKFDNFDINKDNIKVSRQEIEEAYNNTDKKLIESIKKAHNNILAFHKLQMEKTWLYETEDCLPVHLPRSSPAASSPAAAKVSAGSLRSSRQEPVLPFSENTCS